MPSKGQTFDSAGPDIRVRGNAYQVLEKYLQLARDAGTVGDRVAAENFLQHADHYYRVVASMNEGRRPQIGGREISVADVNVQNVSQGLSAALSGMGHGGGGGGEDHESQSGGANGQMRPNQGHQHQGQPHQNSGQNSGDGEHRQASAGGESQPHAAESHDGGNEHQNADQFAPADEQPDYPEELLPAGETAAARDGQEDGNRQDGNRASENRQHGRMGRGRRRGPGRRVRSEGEDAAPPPPPGSDNPQ